MIRRQVFTLGLRLAMGLGAALTPVAFAAENVPPPVGGDVGPAATSSPPGAPAPASSTRERSVITFPTGHRYEGDVKDELPDGRGAMTFPNGERYDGEWRNGVRQGRGAMVFASGQKYEGEWRDDNITGRGMMTWSNGDRYEGELVNATRSGRGAMVFASGQKYDGEWRDDRMTGRGTMTWPNGDRYEGELVDGVRGGRGVMAYADGSRYDGEWRNNQSNGRGVMVWTNGERYDGEWANGNRHGYGVLDIAQGRQYRGDWRDDKPINRILALTEVAPSSAQQAETTPASRSAPSEAPNRERSNARAADESASTTRSSSAGASSPTVTAGPFNGIRKRLAVLRLENKVKTPLPDGSWQIGEGLTEMLTTELFRTGRFVMVERSALTDIVKEQELGQTGLIQKETAAKVGEMLGAQLLVAGAVTEFEASTGGGGGGIGFAGFAASIRTNSAHVAVDIRLIDAMTGQIVKSHSAAAKAEESGVAFAATTRRGVQFGSDAFQKTPLGEATREAIAKAVKFIVSEMENVSWSARVVQAKDQEIIVNAGANMNLQPGLTLEAYSKGEDLIDPTTGVSLGSRDAKVGTVTLRQIEDRYSIGTYAGPGALKRGDLLKLR